MMLALALLNVTDESEITHLKPLNLGAPKMDRHAPIETSRPQVVAPAALEEGQFVRLEEKYILPRSTRDEILEILDFYLEPAYPDPTTDFTLIESVYFDSPQFDLYRNHFGTDIRRCKLRTRKYGPNGKWNNEQILLELKAKTNGVTDKQRLRLPLSQFDGLVNGNPIQVCPELVSHHPKMGPEKMQRRVNDINAEITRYGLMPTARVTYSRKAFERDDFRVTLDEGIASEMLVKPSQKVIDMLFNDPIPSVVNSPQSRAFAMLQQFNPSENILMEVKHRGNIPAWMSRLIANRPHLKASFSKYCYSVTKASLAQAPRAGLRYSIFDVYEPGGQTSDASPRASIRGRGRVSV